MPRVDADATVEDDAVPRVDADATVEDDAGGVLAADGCADRDGALLAGALAVTDAFTEGVAAALHVTKVLGVATARPPTAHDWQRDALTNAKVPARKAAGAAGPFRVDGYAGGAAAR